MAELALGAYALYLGLAFGLRTLLQIRRTGESGFKGISGRAGSPEWAAGVLFVVALVTGVLAPVLALTETALPLDALDRPVIRGAGVALFAGGLAATLAAKVAMGDSWRIGVDATERTDLVTSGPFAVVRNPIFAAMLPASLGLVLMVPSAVAIAGFVALALALELQVRVVEEPYLLRAHGHVYADYAGRVGRFVPAVGRLRDHTPAAAAPGHER